MFRRVLACALAIACAYPAVANDAPAAAPATPAEASGLIDLKAIMTEDGPAMISFTFEGGACQGVGEPEEPVVDGMVAKVTIPTHNTAEVCTMQIVPVPVEVPVMIPGGATTVAVTLLGPDGQVQGEGQVEVAY